jgi:hypothetical protein
MIFALFAWGSAASKWPMTIEQYGVTITNNAGSFRWDFSRTDLQRRVYREQLPGWTFYVKAFSPLQEADLPQWATVATYSMNVARCTFVWDLQEEQCWSIANIYDFEWIPFDDNHINLTSSIYWSSDGEPNMMGQDQYEDWEAEIEFRCTPGNTSMLPNFQFDPADANPKLILQWTNEVSCPAITFTPATATPGPFQPRGCIVQFRKRDEPEFGIYASLAELNNGRFGHAQMVWVASAPGQIPKRQFVLYAPCERMLVCPWGAKCDVTPQQLRTTPTSVWLCTFAGDDEHQSLDTCTAYGVVPSHGLNFTLNNPESVLDGFYYDLDPTSNGKKSRVTLFCDELYPSGHIGLWPESTYISEDGKLNLVGRAFEFCARFVPTPMPMIGLCHINQSIRNDNIGSYYTLDLDLAQFNKDPNNPSEWWNISVYRREGPMNVPFNLLYNPCNGYPCPKGWDCTGDEDAFIWLCEKWTRDHTPECNAYGLHRNNLTMDFFGGFMFNGVVVSYVGSRHKVAHVKWRCEFSIPRTMLAFSDEVIVDENALFFDVFTSFACPVGRGPTPTPPVRYFPRKPSPLPSESIVRSANPHRALFNTSHLVVLDLQTIQERFPARAQQIIEFPTTTGVYYGMTNMVWWSWNTLRCPPDWKCPARNESNMWQCWFDENWEQYCHPVAYKRIRGSRLESLPPGELGPAGPLLCGHLDCGVHFTYKGVSNTQLKLNVTCAPWLSHNDLLFAESPCVYSYNAGTGIGQWSYWTSSGHICPIPFETPGPPTIPRGEPPSKVNQTFKLGAVIKGEYVGLNLKKYHLIEGRQVVGYDIHYHWAEFHFSPYKLIGCPKDKDCGIYTGDQANVWECLIGEHHPDTHLTSSYRKCFPIGDKRWGVKMGHINNSDPNSGITAAYGGGAAGYQVQFDFQCDEAIAAGTLHFPTIGRQNATNYVTVFVHSKEVCPGSEWGEIKGGGYFLIIIASVFVLYFVIGTLINYIITGSVSLLNEEFWTEVSASLSTGALSLVTCGKGQVGGGGTYNDI